MCKKNVLATVAILSIFILISCEKENEPEYVGKWKYIGKIYFTDGSSFDLKEIITFSSSGFDILDQLKEESSDNWVNQVSYSGSLTVRDKKMSMKITKVGLSTWDPITGLPTGQLNYYYEDNKDFATILNDLGFDQNIKTEYSISDDEMTLKFDFNNDGDFTDENEGTLIYTKS
ncbi:hypothetical protein ACFLSA_01650 [Bacteroidota bacterium]